jgi:hypothetical protein
MGCGEDGVWLKSRVWTKPGGLFCVGLFRRNSISFAVKLFSQLIYLKVKCYKYCASSETREDNSA